MLRPLVIWGASGHAKVLQEFLCPEGHEVIALFDNILENSPMEGVPLFYGKNGFLAWKQATCLSRVTGVVAIGGGRGLDRVLLQHFMQDHGIEIISAIHPGAIVASDCTLGTGCQILAGAVVGAETMLGEGCIVNTKASVDHESILGEGCHLAPGATLAGCVEVGRGTLIAVGATVLPRIKIGSNVIVGAGALVTRDIPDNAVVMGQPARIVRWQANPGSWPSVLST